ncbi:hypothetical protein [Archangium violaceum]|uniref:hypothetical protein n=1 Tax=Archangium violaceum TaxID=83451 RepID=UPI00126A466D|nr:hypothetical protein [Archangium violaceum]
MQSSDLIGEWEGDVIDTELGPSVARLFFYKNHRLRVEFDFIEDNAGSMVNEGLYEVREGFLVSNVLGDGNPLKVWLEHGQLMLHHNIDPPLRFRRKSL